MTTELEELLAGLKDQPTERSLAGLEGRVWAAVRTRQGSPSAAAIWGWRSAAAAAVMTLGILLHASDAAHASPEFALFSPRTALAPSTLLGEAR